MNEPQKLRIALIGLGVIAQKAYLPVAANHPRVEPVLCTRDQPTLRRLARQYRIRETYTQVDELIGAGIAAAMVHSATDSHFALVSRLLRAGIPVFVDKPLTYSLEQTEALLALAAQKQVLLYLGFNRRFAPLIRSLAGQPDPIHILWQKNRVDLPDEPRIFVFDDFIHVIDSLRFLAPGEVEDLRVFATTRQDNLESIQVQWRQNGTLLQGSMNRVSGITEERVDYYTRGHTWRIDDLSTGVHYAGEKVSTLGFGSWESTLYKRGFVPMFEDWLSALRAPEFDPRRGEDIGKTHQLCEAILRAL